MIRLLTIGVASLASLIGGVALIAMMGISMADATMRQFNQSIFGASEISEALMVICVACAVPISILSGKAVSIDLLTRQLPKRPRAVLAVLVGTVSVAMLVYYAYRNYLSAPEAAAFGEASLLLSIPYGPLYFCLAIGGALAALALIYEGVKGPVSLSSENINPHQVEAETAPAPAGARHDV